ncbi:peroxidase-like [Ischnura elegans]|uniref:peroxidase-like n=1 Tax=Ischnura elegans TaxID=197161 RepID=UPI001ED89871|nr:peroxidase-like [Ischnura elegans]
MPVGEMRNYKKTCRTADDRCDCPSSTIQSYDGTCNNLKHSSNGVAGTTFKRITLPRYSDGKSTMAKSVVGKSALPSARAVSASLLGTKDDFDATRTLLNAMYLMFVSNDIQEMGARREAPRNPNSCCDSKGRILAEEILPDYCQPIAISESDKFFSTFNQTCLSYQRREIAPRCRRTGAGIQQINLKTSYLDLSVVYGSSKKENEKLRAFEKGHLKTRLVPSGGRRRLPFLPTVENANEVCGISSANSRCYLTANPKVNQIFGLATLQTLFVRLHNGIADKMSTLNPTWSDDELYHEARRITIALYHHFTYNEALPSLLGKKVVEGFALGFKNLSQAYDEDLSAEALSDFAATISPLTASLLPGKIRLIQEDRSVLKEVDLLSPTNYNSVLEEKGSLDSALRGLTTQPSQAFDRYFTEVLIEREVGPDHMMKAGVDQIAIDIQTGRDLGISTYNDAREYCGLDRAVTFEGFSDTMNEEAIGHLQAVYQSPEDVDLSVGLLQESPFGDGMLGFTGGCLIGEQFTRLRLADRFFANVAGFNHSFTEAQLNSILATRFSTVICDASDQMMNIQPDVFRPISPTNPLISCTDLPALDLAPWINSKLPQAMCDKKR